MNALINDFYDCVNLDCICVISNLEIMLLIYEHSLLFDDPDELDLHMSLSFLYNTCMSFCVQKHFVTFLKLVWLIIDTCSLNYRKS